jgi:FixJ family two-component response regulator
MPKKKLKNVGPSSAVKATPTILVVDDDNKAVLEFLLLLLSKNGLAGSAFQAAASALPLSEVVRSISSLWMS